MTTSLPPRRQATRTPGARTGLIKYGMFKRISCDITDISNTGAKLETLSDTDLPETFSLAIRGTGKERRHKCAKRWQDGNMVGVEFLFD